jgi:DNA polymerase-3 subunit gamma/tau
MSYLVLARKWRPRRFAELVGQEHVVRALTHALETGRVHHAFLFTGTRGVGKTTIARIFAKSLNCLNGAGAEPCGECTVCRDVDAGRFVDLLEIDAASNTGVDDVRELIDNAQYMPARGRIKVYLIDEVHMLSKNAFNALLKTLEEPPEHVKFLLATTDPQKLPVTVLSRCLQFNLKRLTVEQIRTQMTAILGAEGIEAEPAAIAQLARAADGSLRDGLSLLDQAIAYGGGALREAEVRAMLGTVDRAQVGALVEALVAADGEALLGTIETVASFAPDFGAALDALAEALHRLQITQLVPAAAPEDERLDLPALAARVPAERVQLWYQMALQGRRELPLAPSERIGFEMALLRMLAFAGFDAEVEPTRPPTRAESSRPSTARADAPVRGEAPTRASEAMPSRGAGAGAVDAIARLSAVLDESPARGPRAEAGSAARAVAPVSPVMAALAARGGAALRLAPEPMLETLSASQPDMALSGAPAMRSPRPPDPLPDASSQPAPAPALHVADPSAVSPPWEDPVRPSDPMATRPATEDVQQGIRDEPVSAPTPRPSLQAVQPPQARLLDHEDWLDLQARCGLGGPVRELAAHSVFVGYDGIRLKLSLPARLEHLRMPATLDALAQKLGEALGHAPQIEFSAEQIERETLHARSARQKNERQAAAEMQFQNHPAVRRLIDQQGLRLVPDSIRPLD